MLLTRVALAIPASAGRLIAPTALISHWRDFCHSAPPSSPFSQQKGWRWGVSKMTVSPTIRPDARLHQRHGLRPVGIDVKDPRNSIRTACFSQNSHRNSQESLEHCSRSTKCARVLQLGNLESPLRAPWRALTPGRPRPPFFREADHVLVRADGSGRGHDPSVAPVLTPLPHAVVVP